MSSTVKVEVKSDRLDGPRLVQRAERFAERVGPQITSNGKSNGVKRRGDVDMFAYRTSKSRIVVEVFEGGTFDVISSTATAGE